MSDQGKNFTVVIGRQFGSGGRKIGRMLADRLGIDYYDKELLHEAARGFGFSTDIFDANDEKRPSLFKSLLQAAYGVTTQAEANPLSGEAIYAAQSKVIRAIAEKGSCVIVGRTADYVLRDNPRCASIFIHAPIGHRANAVVSRGEASNIEQGAEMARKADKKRESYYNYFTGRRWGHSDNYHLSIDASTMSVDNIVELLYGYISSFLEKNN